MIEKIIAESALNKQIILSLSSSQGRTVSANYAVGQLLEGKVEEVLSGQNFLINFKGFKAVAKSTVPLNAGQSVQVKVAQTSPKVILNLVMDGIEEQKAFTFLRANHPSSTNEANIGEKPGRVLTGEKLSAGSRLDNCWRGRWKRCSVGISF